MGNPKTEKHVAIRNAKVGIDKKGKPRKIIKLGDTLELTEAQVKGYRTNKIIA